METKNYVTYEDFGAVGDGVTDDFAAIYKAHEYANENKLPVEGKAGAKTIYNIVINGVSGAQPCDNLATKGGQEPVIDVNPNE